MAGRLQNNRGEGILLRAEILDAAMRVLDRSPIAELSLRTVAREAGISAPAIYAHFESREAMTYEVIRCCWQQLADDMSRAARRARAKGPVEQLRRLVRAYLRYAMASPARYQLLFALRPEGVADSAYQVRPAEPAFLAILKVVDALPGAGHQLPMSDSHRTTLLLLSIMHGRVALARTTPDRPWNARQSINAFLDEVVHDLFGPLGTAGSLAERGPAPRDGA